MQLHQLKNIRLWYCSLATISFVMEVQMMVRKLHSSSEKTVTPTENKDKYVDILFLLQVCNCLFHYLIKTKMQDGIRTKLCPVLS